MAPPNENGKKNPQENGKRSSQDNGKFLTPENGKKSRPNSIAERRGEGLRIVNGIAIPPHMKLPQQDGFRTPTGEDYDHLSNPHRRVLDRLTGDNHHHHHTNGHGGHFHHGGLEGLGNVHFHFFTPNPSAPGTPRGSVLARSRLSLSAVSEALEKTLKWRQRMRHFTWTFFTSTMATGGIANVLYAVPYRFNGIDTIGTIFFLLNIVLFIGNVFCISARFIMFPETFKASLTHPTESLFMPAAVVSFGTILINISQYGLYNVGPWLNEAVIALFWLDVALAVFASAGTYLMMWSTQTFTIAQMTPVWIFPAYPLLIIGTHAGVLSKSLDQQRALDIIIGGFTLQGIGFMVSLMIYAAFIYRLMTQKLPKENLRPGMFVSVGPSGFTCAGIIGMAANTRRAFDGDFMKDGDLAAAVLRICANWAGLWLWGLAMWFFFISVGAHISCVRKAKLQFSMTWFSFVFPNTALTAATFAIGAAFESNAISVIGCVMTCILIVVWIWVCVMMIKAIWQRQILWPQRQEDRDEGGFKAPKMRRGSIGHKIFEKTDPSSIV